MFVVSEALHGAFSAKAEDDYLREMRGWLGEQPELAPMIGRADYQWCKAAMRHAQQDGIESEDAIARFARLALLCGEGWFSQSAAQDILKSDNDGNLKVFQLECLQEGVTDGEGATDG